MGKGLSSMALSPTMESPTSDDVFQHVKGCKEKGKTWWWQCVRVVLVSLKGNSEVICQLQCKRCDTFLSPSIPSNACKTHLKGRNCSGYREGVKMGSFLWRSSQQQQKQALAAASCSPAAATNGKPWASVSSGWMT